MKTRSIGMGEESMLNLSGRVKDRPQGRCMVRRSRMWKRSPQRARQEGEMPHMTVVLNM